jgi:hypothetical protein
MKLKTKTKPKGREASTVVLLSNFQAVNSKDVTHSAKAVNHSV